MLQAWIDKTQLKSKDNFVPLKGKPLHHQQQRFQEFLSGTNHQPEIKVTDVFRQSSSTIILASLQVSSANEGISNKQNDLPKLMINMFEILFFSHQKGKS